MKITKEVKIGIFVIIVLSMFYIAIRFAKGLGISSFGKNSYYTIYDKGGLRPGDSVSINGLYVGSVNKVTFLKEGFRAKVDFSVRNDIELTDRVTALLSGGGFLGGRNSIKLVFEKEIGKPLEPGSEIPGKIEPGVTEEIVENTIPVLNDIKATSAIIGEMTAGLAKNTYKINSAITNLELMTFTLKDYFIKNKQLFDDITRNVSKVLVAFADEKQGLGPLVANINNTVGKISTIDTDSINKSFKEIRFILEKMQSNVGTAGRLINDPQLYQNINQTIESLNSLLINLKEQPGRYVRFSLFGRRNSGRK